MRKGGAARADDEVGAITWIGLRRAAASIESERVSIPPQKLALIHSNRFHCARVWLRQVRGKHAPPRADDIYQLHRGGRNGL